MGPADPSRSDLSTHSESFADCRLVSVRGRIDHTNSDGFQGALGAAAREVPKGGGMVVDLGGVEFITSAGLRALLLAQRTVSAAGSKLVVCGIDGVVREVFRIARFDVLLSVADSTEKAIAQVSPAAAEAYSG
jgi:anti-sigma B factor antagonist